MCVCAAAACVCVLPLCVCVSITLEQTVLTCILPQCDENICDCFHFQVVSVEAVFGDEDTCTATLVWTNGKSDSLSPSNRAWSKLEDYSVAR